MVRIGVLLWNISGGVTAIHRIRRPSCSLARYSGASSLSRRDVTVLLLPADGAANGRLASSVIGYRPGVAPCRLTALSPTPFRAASNCRLGPPPSWPAG